MEYRRLGRSGLEISEMALGTMQFGWTADEEAAFAVTLDFSQDGVIIATMIVEMQVHSHIHHHSHHLLLPSREGVVWLACA